jgi:hypothetical protein
MSRATLPKFRKSVDELVTDFDKWCYLLRHLPELTDRPQRLQEKVFSKVFEIAEIAKYSPAEAAAYEDSLKVLILPMMRVRRRASLRLPRGW